jgi:hypothetical protein
MTILVSAYFKIPSKQSHAVYLQYLRYFFDYLQGKPILFFCSQEVKDEIESFGFNIDSVQFKICTFHELPILQTFPWSFWERHKILDIEPYHTPELGIIWASKKEFLKQAMDMYPDDWFVWIDAGCIRKPEWQSYCKHFTNRLTMSNPGIYVQTLNPIPMNRSFFQFTGERFVAGGLIYAHRNYILPYCEAYNNMLLEYDVANKSVIMDQYVIASLVTKNNNEWLHTIQYQKDDHSCPDEWFFFLQYL